MPLLESRDATNFYEKFIDIFLKVKAAKLKDVGFFVWQRERLGYFSNQLIEKNDYFSEYGYLFRALKDKLIQLDFKTFIKVKNSKKVFSTQGLLYEKFPRIFPATTDQKYFVCISAQSKRLLT